MMASGSDKTPKKCSQKEDSIGAGDVMSNVQFSPVPVSPGRTPTKGQITGLPRKVKDLCADLHNLIYQWNKDSKRGFELTTNIVNFKLKNLNENTKVLPHDSDILQNNEELEAMCQQTTELVASMEKIAGKMASVDHMMKGLAELENYQSKDSFIDEPLFQTWNMDTFCEFTEEIVRSYHEELSLKQIICQNIAHSEERSLQMFYVALWLHQPYINENIDLNLESLLTETGHR